MHAEALLRELAISEGHRALSHGSRPGNGLPVCKRQANTQPPLGNVNTPLIE